MNSTAQSYLIHLVAGALIVIIPLAIAGIPQSVQAVTVGGVLGIVLKFAHDVAGY